MEWRRLNLVEIETALRRLSEAAETRGAVDPTTAEVAERLASGYAYVDDLLRDRVDLFAYGEAHHILELNHRVLCGVAPAVRREFRDHIEATERWFYDQPEAGMAGFSDWYHRHDSRAAIPLAAGLIVETVSTPQLFIEGNRRTAALLASYALARRGEPPFVAGPESFGDYDTLSRRAAALDRAGFADALMARLVAYRLAILLREASDPRFLAPIAPAPAAPRAVLSEPQRPG